MYRKLAQPYTHSQQNDSRLVIVYTFHSIYHIAKIEPFCLMRNKNKSNRRHRRSKCTIAGQLKFLLGTRYYDIYFDSNKAQSLQNHNSHQLQIAQQFLSLNLSTHIKYQFFRFQTSSVYRSNQIDSCYYLNPLVS